MQDAIFEEGLRRSEPVRRFEDYKQLGKPDIESQLRSFYPHRILSLDWWKQASFENVLRVWHSNIPKNFPNSRPTIQSRIALENKLYNKSTSEFDFSSIYDWGKNNPSLKELAIEMQKYFVQNSPFINKDQKALDQILTNLELNLVKPMEKFNAIEYYNKLS